jgi:hypothetical protein
MGLQMDIEFDELVKIAKKLPQKQWTKLKAEVESEKLPLNVDSELESSSLTAPTFTKKQLDEITKTRKVIIQWRKK